MPVRKIIIGVVLFFLASVPTAKAYFEDMGGGDDVEVYQNKEFLLTEEDPGQNRFYALVKRAGLYKYVQYNGYYNEVYSITNLFNLEDLSDAVSTIDPYNRRYFFTTSSGDKSNLYVLGLDSGEIINRKTYDYKIRAMGYDNESGTVIGLAQSKNGNSKTVRIDPATCQLTPLADLSRTYNMDYNSAFLRPDKQEVWITASNRRNEYILTISTENGKASAIRVISVEPERQIVYNFNTMKFNQVLFASGTPNSIILTGFNEMYKTAFILHMTISSRNVKEQIEKIQEQLLEFSPGGINDYKLTVICGKHVENIVSYSKALALETKIKELYGIKKITHKEFFIGRPYKIVISAEGMSVY